MTDIECMLQLIDSFKLRLRDDLEEPLRNEYIAPVGLDTITFHFGDVAFEFCDSSGEAIRSFTYDDIYKVCDDN